MVVVEVGARQILLEGERRTDMTTTRKTLYGDKKQTIEKIIALLQVPGASTPDEVITTGLKRLRPAELNGLAYRIERAVENAYQEAEVCRGR